MNSLKKFFMKPLKVHHFYMFSRANKLSSVLSKYIHSGSIYVDAVTG